MNNKSISLISKQGLIYSLGSFSQAVLPFLMLPLLTKEMNPTDYGIYSLIFITSTLFGGIFYLGMTSALPRSYFDYETSEERNAVYSTSLIILLIGAGLQILFAMSFGKILSRLLFDTSIYNLEIFWAFLFNSLNWIFLHFISYLRLKKDALLSVALSLSITLLSILFLQLMFNILDNENMVRNVYKVLSFSNFFILLISSPKIFKDFRFDKKIFAKEISLLLKYGLASVSVNITQYFFDWQDRFIVEYFTGLEIFGIYAAIAKIASIGNVILVTPFVFVWNPIMMESRRKSNIKNIFKIAINIYLTLASLLLIPILIFSSYLIEILLKSDLIPLSELYLPFFILTLGVLTYGLVNIVSAGILFSRKIYLTIFIFVPLAFLKFILGYQFIDRFGINGAAYSSLICSILLVYMMYKVANRYFFIKPDYKTIKRIFLYLTISMPLSFLIVTYSNIFTLNIFFTFIMIFGGIYFIYQTFIPLKIINNMLKK